jgi:phosphoenolpyruvate---glycerone phosphotransferase subunit DhaL
VNTALIVESIHAVQRAILSNEDQIESLDRAIGDGDHFINVRRGCEVVAALSTDFAADSPAQAFNKIGMKLLSTIGGASGPLISSLFLAMGKALNGIAEPDRRQFAAAFTQGVEAIRQRGKADVGEKTMLDVLIPAAHLLEQLASDGTELQTICDRLSEDATRNMLSTKNMIATKGRAHFLGERALGHIDPGCKTCEVAILAVCQHIREKVVV